MTQEQIDVNTSINNGWRFHYVGLVNQDPCQSRSNENMVRWTEAKLWLLFNENSIKEAS